MKELKEKLKDIPKNPGVYQFLNKDGGVIYVGKAKNLKSRVSQYFNGHDSRPQLPYLMAEATDFNYTIVTNELESAFLENTLIKQYSPKYNIDLKDDKNYAFITIDYSTQIPQIGYARKIENYRRHSKKIHPTEESQKPNQRSFATLRMTPKVKYFGPYSAAYKIRNTLNLVRRIFPFCAAQKVGTRPCFYYYMHRCPGVCIGKISLNDYNLHLDKIIKFLQGDISSVVKEIAAEMAESAKSKKFEAAARLRDQLRALQILQKKQNVILTKKVNWDIISLGTSDGFACINLFKIREGKMFDKENFVYELPFCDFDGRQNRRMEGQQKILQRFLEQYYLETSSAPKCIYTQMSPEDGELIEHIISSRFNRKAALSIPQKGKVAKLVNLGKINAEEYLKNWLNAKAGHLDKINQALEQLKQILNLPIIPKRIECYDISNTQGTNPVGSMVVFENGLPAKSQYRKFKIYGKKNPDDFAMMREMLTRRFSRRHSESRVQPRDEESQTKKEILRSAQDDAKWPMPDIIVIDGGKGQLSAAMEVLKKFQVTSNKLQVVGLAKRIEEIFIPEKSEPIILDHDNPALQLLQRLRDEAHRFGITFHRKLRSKQAIKSALDDIPGVGPKTKKLLKSKFGTVAEIKQTSHDELSKVVGEKLANKIKQSL